MKITHYRTVSATHAGLLDDVVNELIQKGYQPYGSPYADTRTVNAEKVQPVTRQAMVLIGSRSSGAKTSSSARSFRNNSKTP